MVIRLLIAALALGSTVSMAGCDSSSANPRFDTSPPECELRIELPARIKQNGRNQIKVRINNVGKTPVTLVMPGDGSSCGWRTPVISWSLKPLDATKQNPELQQDPVGRCGNINRLEPREVFVLQPGEGMDLNHWSVGFPYGMSPGKYRAVFHYSNVPDLKWHGLPLGKHDRATMRRVKRSTPISLVSNEVEIEIIE